MTARVGGITGLPKVKAALPARPELKPAVGSVIRCACGVRFIKMSALQTRCAKDCNSRKRR